MILRLATWLLAGLLALTAVGSLLLMALLLNRPDLDASGVPLAPAASTSSELSVTYLGVTSLLFDDGETQLLVDGFFTRPLLTKILAGQAFAPDERAIDKALADFKMDRLAAITAVHSHYDHAMDVGVIAAKTGALVIGSESTANIARGAGVRETQIQVTAPGTIFDLGRFTLELIPSAHAPLGGRVQAQIADNIDEPLIPPQPLNAWQMGGAYTLEITHGDLVMHVQGSAGRKEGSMDGRRAQISFLGMGGLAQLGDDYEAAYWKDYVTDRGVTRVFPVHHDDFLTQPLGVIAAPPIAVVGDVGGSLARAKSWADAAGIRFEQLPFGKKIALRP